MSHNDVEIQLPNGHNVNFKALDHEFKITFLLKLHEFDTIERMDELKRLYNNAVSEYKYNFLEQILEIIRQYGDFVIVDCEVKLLVSEENKDIRIGYGDRIWIKMGQSHLSKLPARVLNASFQEIGSVDSRGLKLKFKTYGGSPKGNNPSIGSVMITLKSYDKRLWD